MQILANARDGLSRILRPVAIGYVALLAATALISVALSAAGVWPWLKVDLPGWDYAILPGQAIQIAIAVFALALLLYLPASLKVVQLDHAHRRFTLTMEDITRAYEVSHRADREGTFNLSSEFDAVRERMAFLRRHPDLTKLEPEVLETAAQMSQVSQELAKVYSDANVERARAVLKQRQTEIAELTDRINQAKLMTDELRRWTTQVSVEESVADSQIAQLCKDLAELLPELNDGTVSGKGSPTPIPKGSKVVSIPAKKAGKANAVE